MEREGKRERERQRGLSGNYYTQRGSQRASTRRVGVVFALGFSHFHYFSFILRCTRWHWCYCHCHYRGQRRENSSRRRERSRDDFAAGLICRFSVLSVLRATCRLPTTSKTTTTTMMTTTTTYYYGNHCCNPQPIQLVLSCSSSLLSAIVFNICSAIFIFYFQVLLYLVSRWACALCS